MRTNTPRLEHELRTLLTESIETDDWAMISACSTLLNELAARQLTETLGNRPAGRVVNVPLMAVPARPEPPARERVPAAVEWLHTPCGVTSGFPAHIDPTKPGEALSSGHGPHPCHGCGKRNFLWSRVVTGAGQPLGDRLRRLPTTEEQATVDAATVARRATDNRDYPMSPTVDKWGPFKVPATVDGATVTMDIDTNPDCSADCSGDCNRYDRLHGAELEAELNAVDVAELAPAKVEHTPDGPRVVGGARACRWQAPRNNGDGRIQTCSVPVGMIDGVLSHIDPMTGFTREIRSHHPQ